MTNTLIIKMTENVSFQRIFRLLLLGLIAGIVTILVLGIWGEFSQSLQRIQNFNTLVIPFALLLSLINYCLRWVRWHFFLKKGDNRVSISLSIKVFLSGLAMSITPGKVGEVLKVALLKDRANIKASKTFPIVVAERIYDLLAVVLLTGFGVLEYGKSQLIFLFGGLFLVLIYLLFYTKFGWIVLSSVFGFLVRKRIPKETEREAYEVQKTLLSGKHVIFGMTTGVLAWLAEGVGLYLVVCGFENANISVGSAIFIYSAGTLAGCLSMIPGGLVTTEVTLTGMMSPYVFGIFPDDSSAVSSTIIIRLVTLWFAVLLGVIGLVLMYRKTSER